AAHQVHAGEKLVGGEDAVEGLAGDFGELGRARAGGYECGVVAHFGDQLRNGEELADDRIEPDLDPHLLEVLDFVVDNHVGKPELGDAVFQDTARDMQGFEDRDLDAVPCQFSGAGQPGRTGTDDGGFLTRRVVEGGELVPAAAHGAIGHEAFQSS